VEEGKKRSFPIKRPTNKQEKRICDEGERVLLFYLGGKREKKGIASGGSLEGEKGVHHYFSKRREMLMNLYRGKPGRKERGDG